MVPAVSVLLLVAGVLPALGARAAVAGTCVSWSGAQPPNPGTDRDPLAGVAVLSPCDAWAVGLSSSADTDLNSLIEHWNGSSWTVTPSAVPGSVTSDLAGVHAISAANIWAVGGYTDASRERTLTLHWNGTAWKQVPSPSVGSFPGLNAVDAVSATDVWAVGAYSLPSGFRTLIEHWNGRAWRQVPSPTPGKSAVLTGVAAVSATNAWAVGDVIGPSGDQSLILHWNGRAWMRAASPNPGLSTDLFAVDATSASNAWAVGDTYDGTGRKSVIVHWNGHNWARVPSPNRGGPADFNELFSVAALPSGAAWAVGAYTNVFGDYTLVLAWNGRTWQRQPSPTPGKGKANAHLLGVAASSATSVWAVGYYLDILPQQALALHCC
jgi:hypothetical protein